MKRTLSQIIIAVSLILLSGNCIFAQQQLTNLPTVYLTTQNSQAVTDKENWISGNIKIVSSDASENLDMAMTIRGRGNSTWSLAKKPYRVKLDSKTKILNLSAKAKNWVLLANHADKTLIRNAVAFKVSELLGFEFTPAARFVDVYLNGEFLGNYMLTDQMEQGSNRVDVEDMSADDISEPNLTGGYLLEIDGFAEGEPVWFTSSKALKITVKYPKDDEINTQQFNYIKQFTNRFESALFSSDFKDENLGYRNLVDTTSLINWYIASELTGNPDCFWSTYIYKRRGIDKFFFGPLWDFDIAFNNDNRLGDATLSLMREKAFAPRTWIERLWSDEWFRAAVNRRWKELVGNGILDSLLAYIDRTALEIDASQQLNYNRWKVLSTRVYREQFLFTTYQRGVDYLKTYLANRVDFLTESFEKTQPQEPSAPFVAENFYYRIINQGTNNAIDVDGNAVAPSSNLVMWAPIEEDPSQQWLIRALNNSAFQIVNRNSGLAMAGNGRGNNLIQIAVNESDNSQQWKITPVLTGNMYGLENVKSGYSVNNSGGGFSNGTPVIEYDNNIFLSEKVNQHWFIEKYESIDDGTAIQNTEREKAVRIFPTIISDRFSVTLGSGCGSALLTLYSPSGIKAFSTNCKVGLNTVEVSGLPKGIYIGIINGKNWKQAFKIVKTR
ncbi:MAG: CotH kinase family protein [Dysgonamonadaceae bacterium]|jgi:hypothetical protein|nr:CotH kinase family protein [Dysgonamonadaceae bacterium]